jgi:hypothetical protein
MNTLDLELELEAYLRHGRWVHLEGQPGTAKTTIPLQVLGRMGWGALLINVPMHPYEDWGIPVPNAERTAIDFLSPGGLPFVDEDGPDHGAIIFDELASGDISQQKAAAHIGQAREIHGRRIKPGWSIISTGNRARDGAGANRLLSHLRDRMTVLPVNMSPEGWQRWAAANGVDPMLRAFLRFREGLLSPEFDPGLPTKQPTARSWAEGVSWKVAAFGGSPNELEHYAGDVGEGAAAEFIGFLRLCRSLPDIDTVIRDPHSGFVPTDPATLFAISGALAARATQDNFSNIIAYARRMGPEYGLLVVQDAVHRDASLRKTRAYIEWVTTDGKDLVQAA